MTVGRWYLVSALAPAGALIAYMAWVAMWMGPGRLFGGALPPWAVTVSFSIAMAIMPVGLVLMHVRCKGIGVLHRFFLRNGKTNGHENSYLGDRIFILLVGRENLRPSHRRSPAPYVPAQTVPSSSAQRACTLWASIDGVFPRSRTSNSAPSNRTSPSSVPIQSEPSAAWVIARTEFIGSPSAVCQVEIAYWLSCLSGESERARGEAARRPKAATTSARRTEGGAIPVSLAGSIALRALPSRYAGARGAA